jgi:hypothetical protein
VHWNDLLTWHICMLVCHVITGMLWLYVHCQHCECVAQLLSTIQRCFKIKHFPKSIPILMMIWQIVLYKESQQRAVISRLMVCSFRAKPSTAGTATSWVCRCESSVTVL